MKTPAIRIKPGETIDPDFSFDFLYIYSEHFNFLKPSLINNHNINIREMTFLKVEIEMHTATHDFPFGLFKIPRFKDGMKC